MADIHFTSKIRDKLFASDHNEPPESFTNFDDSCTLFSPPTKPFKHPLNELVSIWKVFLSQIPLSLFLHSLGLPAFYVKRFNSSNLYVYTWHALCLLVWSVSSNST